MSWRQGCDGGPCALVEPVDDGTRQPNVISLKEFELNFPAQGGSIRYGRTRLIELPAPSSQYTSKGDFHDDFLQNRRCSALEL
jgi:hypothetical protein